MENKNMNTIKITNMIEFNFAKQILVWLFTNESDSLLIAGLISAINEFEQSEEYKAEQQFKE
jgi:hypothetical protein